MSAELKKKLSSLLTLQHHYVQLVEEEDEGHSETLNNYIDLIDNLKGQMKKSTFISIHQLWWLDNRYFCSLIFLFSKTWCLLRKSFQYV